MVPDVAAAPSGQSLPHAGSVGARRRRQLPDADQRSAGPGNRGTTRMAHAPGLILAAPDTLARHAAAMEVRTTAAQRERGRDRRRQGGGKNDDSGGGAQRRQAGDSYHL